VCVTGSLRVGSGAEAGGFGVAAGLAVDWGWEDWELFVVGGFVGVSWACAGGGEAEVGGDDEGVVLVVDLVTSTAVAIPPAATAAARDELGGEADGVGWLVKLWLLQGGVALSWAGEPAGLSMSMGDVSARGWVDAAAAYEQGAAVMGVAAASWEADGCSVSMGVVDVSLVCLEVAVGHTKSVFVVHFGLTSSS